MDDLFNKRILELANMCYNRQFPVSTDFLDLNKQTVFLRMLNEIPPVSYVMDGGYEPAERKVLIFYPYEGFPFNEPYNIISIKPVNVKFAKDLSHRDYLGALLNLGITRDKTGDIIIDNGTAYVFVISSISQYICENLTRVKNTTVVSQVIEKRNFDYVPNVTNIQGSVASVRLDSVISVGFSDSRSHITSYITEGRVAVNGRIITSNGYKLKEGDLISVRGLGKIRYTGSSNTTKKGRIIVNVDKFI